jgi:hypothetical protein
MVCNKYYRKEILKTFASGLIMGNNFMKSQNETCRTMKGGRK